MCPYYQWSHNLAKARAVPRARQDTECTVAERDVQEEQIPVAKPRKTWKCRMERTKKPYMPRILKIISVKFILMPNFHLILYIYYSTSIFFALIHHTIHNYQTTCRGEHLPLFVWLCAESAEWKCKWQCPSPKQGTAGQGRGKLGQLEFSCSNFLSHIVLACKNFCSCI